MDDSIYKALKSLDYTAKKHNKSSQYVLDLLLKKFKDHDNGDQDDLLNFSKEEPANSILVIGDWPSIYVVPDELMTPDNLEKLEGMDSHLRTFISDYINGGFSNEDMRMDLEDQNKRISKSWDRIDIPSDKIFNLMRVMIKNKDDRIRGPYKKYYSINIEEKEQY